ncbi:DUF3352 domain-containing protein [Nostoc sp. FACHB-280]|uniref:DUF3352 domain-containing protein n=1 Tax=Nostoc sp. FACHB-280 TaxID=2692839 RepID=UPI00168A516E|nr:DUF3352 domain-containing protein [Nostoc sp. FACHB-280]MBD2496500.1 DUF3352 domain-containing protein [Nostoc sp. FACHB-280]
MVSPIITVSLLSVLAVASPVAEKSEAEASTTLNVPAIAKILPADTPLVSLINTKVDAWADLNRFYLFDRAFSAVAQYLPPSFKLDYVREIESLLGEQVAAAFLPKVEGTTATLENNFIMLAPLKDESRIQPLLDLLKNSDPKRVKVSEYKGVNIIELQVPEPAEPPKLPESNPETESIPPLPELPKAPESNPETESTAPLPESPKAPEPAASPESNLKKLTILPTKSIKIPQKPTNSLTKSNLAAIPPILGNPDWLKRRPKGLAIATLPGYVVTGFTAKAIEQIIDTSQGENNLAQNPQFQETIKHPQYAKSLFAIHENLATFVPLISEIAKDPSLPFPIFGSESINLDELKEYGSVNGFLTVEPEGLRFQATAYRQTPKSEKDEFQTEQPEAIVSRLPGATYSAATGRNLNQKWLLIAKALSTEPKLKEYLDQLRSFVLNNTKLDLEKDILNWMDGDYAFFLFPSKGGLLGSIPNLNLGIGIALETNNRDAAETTLKKLDELIKSFSNGEVVVNTQDIQGQTITSWDINGESSQSLLAYNWVDEKTLVISTGFGAIKDLVPQPYIPLPTTYNFKTATNTLPRPNYGYFYLNGGSTLSWIYGFAPSFFDDKSFQPWKSIIGSVYSLSATSSTTPDKEQVDFLMVLAPTRRPINPVGKE